MFNIEYTEEMEKQDYLYREGKEDTAIMRRLHQKIIRKAKRSGFEGEAETYLSTEFREKPEVITDIYNDKEKWRQRLEHFTNTGADNLSNTCEYLIALFDEKIDEPVYIQLDETEIEDVKYLFEEFTECFLPTKFKNNKVNKAFLYGEFASFYENQLTCIDLCLPDDFYKDNFVYDIGADEAVEKHNKALENKSEMIKGKEQLKLGELIMWGSEKKVRNKTYTFKNNQSEVYSVYFDEHGDIVMTDNMPNNAVFNINRAI